MTKILAIGGNSFIGQKVLLKLKKKHSYEIEITYFSKKSSSNLFKQHYLDILNFKKKDLKKFSNIDHLILFSWYDLNDYNSKQHNLISKRLTKLAYFFILNGVKNISVLGTCLEYGLVNGSIDEKYECLPVTKYGKAKLNLLNNLKVYKKNYNFNLNWLRIFYIYGDDRLNRGIWSLFKTACQSRNNFKMSGGEQIRDFISFDKLITYLSLLINLNKDLGVVNVCSGNPIKLINLINRWKRKFNPNINLMKGFYPYTSYETMSYWGNNKKLIKNLNEKK